MKTQEASLFTSYKKVVLSVLFFVGLFLIQTEQFSQVKTPDTPAGKRLTEFIELINVNDKAAIEKYVNENLSLNFKSAMPIERHVGMINQIHDNMGKIVIHEIESSEDYHIKGILLSSSMNSLLSFEMMLEETEPYKIDRMGFRPAGSYTPETDEKKPETKTTTDEKK